MPLELPVITAILRSLIFLRQILAIANEGRKDSIQAQGFANRRLNTRR